MNLVGLEVQHDVKFGRGKIIAQDSRIITVKFASAEIKFPYLPVKDSRLFKYLTFVDESVNKDILEWYLSQLEKFEYDGCCYYGDLSNHTWRDSSFLPLSHAENEIIDKYYLSQLERKAKQAKIEAERAKREAEEAEFLQRVKVQSELLSDKGFLELYITANEKSSKLADMMHRYESIHKIMPRNLAETTPEEKELAREIIPYYELAIEKLLTEDQFSKDEQNVYLKLILPALSSKYRSAGFPERCIKKLYKQFKNHRPGVFTHAFWISLSGAFCDLDDYDNAIVAIKNAIFLLCQTGRRPNEPIMGVLFRIEAMHKRQADSPLNYTPGEATTLLDKYFPDRVYYSQTSYEDY